MIPLALMLLLHLIAGSTICLLWKFCYCYIWIILKRPFEFGLRLNAIEFEYISVRIISAFIQCLLFIFFQCFLISDPFSLPRFIKRILYNQALFKVIYAIVSIQKQMHTYFQCRKKKKNVPLNAPISNQTQNYHYMLLLCRIVHFRLICNNNILWSLYKSFPIVISSETVDEHRHFHFVNGVWLGTVLARFIFLHISTKW